MVYQTWRCWLTPLILTFTMTCESSHVRCMQLVVLLQRLRRRHLQLRLLLILCLLSQKRALRLMLPCKEN